MKVTNPYLFFLLCLVFSFTACSSDDSEKEHSGLGQDKESTHFFGVKQFDGLTTKGVTQSPKLWNQLATVRVKFLNGNEENKRKVKEYANEWLQHIQIKFQFVESGDAEVRISFEGDDDPINRYVTWSYTGTDCKKISDQSVPTANFAFFDYVSEDDQKAEALRLFGQILGLEFEHRHLEADPKWNKNKNLIRNYWEGNITDVLWSELEQYVFTPFENTNIIIETKEFDPSSIMLWAFPRNIASSPDFWYSNYELSDKDIEFVKLLYGEKNMELAIEMISHGTNVSGDTFFLFGPDSVYVDWGWDGISKGYKSKGDVVKARLEPSFLPPYGGEYLTKIYFNPSDLTEFNLSYFRVSSIDLSKCKNLTSLYLAVNPQLTHLDLSENTKLTYLNLQSNSMTEIDLSKNINFEEIMIFNCKLTGLDVSKNKKLKRVQLETCPFMANRESLVAFVESLPNNTNYNESYLSMRISNQPTEKAEWVKNICMAKGWKLFINGVEA